VNCIDCGVTDPTEGAIEGEKTKNPESLQADTGFLASLFGCGSRRFAT
jgi:hypothetical protein